MEFPHNAVILVDSYRANSFVLKDQSAVKVGPSEEGRNNHEYSLYHADFVLYNQEIECDVVMIILG